jgi:uncharacterized protein (TIGR02996 family)
LKPKKRKKKSSTLDGLTGDTPLKMAPLQPLPRWQPRRRRRGMFRLLAVASPLILLVLAEVGLRFGGYGYATSFFLRSEIGGREVFINNPDFARRFFPPGLARTPEAFSMPASKPEGVTRIFVFGESAAMGDPLPAYGVSRMLEMLLNARFPARKFEVVNVAVTAINSHVVREIARDCADKQGDVWIIYLGNNEVVGPFGAGTIFGNQAPPLPLIRAQLALKRTRLGQLLDDLKWRVAPKPDVPRTWEGMEMFLQQQVRHDEPRMKAVYQHFDANLRDIVNRGLEAGAQVVLSTVVSNLKDCPPFASAHRPGLSESQRNEWARLVQAGATDEDAGRFEEALAGYQQAAQIDDQYAELQFRLGRCWLALGRTNEARTAFSEARDLDTLRFRADSSINERIAATARAFEPSRVRLVDAADVLAGESPGGLPGSEFLFEHVHFRFAGNYRLARVLADSVVTVLENSGPPWTATNTTWLAETECAQRLAFTEFDRAQILDEMVKRLELPPCSSQLGHARRLERLRAELNDARLAAERKPAADIALYRAAIASAPEDATLRQGFADLLMQHGDAASALEHRRRAVELEPQSAQTWFQLGNTLDALGKPAEAVSAFERALRTQPDAPETLNALGLALSSCGRHAEALRKFEEALRRQPDFTGARINLGQLLAQLGLTREAEAHYREAIRLESNSVAGHINLGKMLAARQEWTNAVAHYRVALRVQPDNWVGHYNLGNALSALGSEEAITHYAEAARLKPDSAEARYNLALTLAKQGRNQEALTQFAAAVKLRPDFVDGHFNYGVALAKERRFHEAAEQFEATLRLQPGNDLARKFLDQARATQ